MGIDQSSVIGGESTEIPDCLRCAELDVLRSWWSKLQERGGGACNCLPRQAGHMH